MKEHILGMEPDSVARQIIRNYFSGCAPDRAIGVEDCLALMMEFNRHLVGLNESLQKLVLDKIGTELPVPFIRQAKPAGEPERK
jgi:hypothetical protein